MAKSVASRALQIINRYDQTMTAICKHSDPDGKMFQGAARQCKAEIGRM